MRSNTTIAARNAVSTAPEIANLGDYDVTKQDWYRGAQLANGETYISSVYTDAATGLPVVTMCRTIPESGSFLAIDMKPDCFAVDRQDVDLPEQTSYFLVDQEGTLLYDLSSWDCSREELQALVDNYREITI